MYINPRTAIQQGWITGITDLKKQVQPNAIDFTLDKLFSINYQNTFIISEEGKQMRGGDERIAVPDRASGEEFWLLSGSTVYDGMSNIIVDLPEGVACELIIRSTLNRNGLFLTSGLYDSGFKGHIGFAIHNRSGDAKIGVGTRVGQIKFVASDSAGVYAGGYNHKEGSYREQFDELGHDLDQPGDWGGPEIED